MDPARVLPTQILALKDRDCKPTALAAELVEFLKDVSSGRWRQALMGQLVVAEACCSLLGVVR